MSATPAVTDIDTHLAAVATLLDRVWLDDGARRAMLERHAAIVERRRDPSVYLAVLGEFSSGKSSIVNALIRERLLKTSALVSSCVVTELSHGEEMSFEASFTDGAVLNFPDNRRELGHKLEELGITASDDGRELLRAVTCEQAIAAHLGRVRVKHPGPLLADGVVLLDTPGISSEHAAHTECAMSVASRADLFLVVIPSLSPLSEVFRGFLRDQLGEHLRRAVFVLTKMASVERDEHDELIRFVERRIATDLRVQDPVVLPVSVPAVLDRLTAPAGPGSVDDAWMRHFEAFERHLTARLRHERELAVSERLITLLEQLMIDLTGALHERADELRASEAVLAQHRVQDLESFADERLAEGRVHIAERGEAQRAATRARHLKRRGKALAEIWKAIDKAATPDALKSAATDGTDAALTRARDRIRQDIRASSRSLAKEAAEVLQDFDDAFEASYCTLERLSGETVAFAPVRQEVLEGQTAAAAVHALQAQLESDGSARAFGGAAAGAAIGTLLVPGLGTVIGGGLGALASRLFGPTLREQQSATRARLEPALAAAFADAEQLQLERIDEQTQAALQELERHAAAYLDHYGALIDRMVAEHREQRRMLAADRRRSETDLLEVESHMRALQTEIRELEEFTAHRHA